jgi:hypothetical protein
METENEIIEYATSHNQVELAEEVWFLKSENKQLREELEMYQGDNK